MNVITSTKVPIKSWCGDIDPRALEQAENLANHPRIYHHVALMPDCHVGYGMPIGGVVAVADAVIPNCVGVDIGCGMAAARTTLTHIDPDTIKSVFAEVRRLIPVGFNHHGENQDWDGFYSAPDLPVVQQELGSARRQLGTLGGGNHFIEIQSGDDGRVWFMIHSGSRNFGYKIANHYHRVATALNAKWATALPSQDLAFLPADSPEALDYLSAMDYALWFADQNRRRMMTQVGNTLERLTGGVVDDFLSIHHNYAAPETHFGRAVMVHRKGATSARPGERGIIPGSLGTSSYIVVGRGNPDSYSSCSHGAGRIMGRKEASRTLDLDSVVASLDARGIIHGIRTARELDEAPGAYKDIDVVMEAQSDLVETRVKLTPLGVVKG